MAAGALGTKVIVGIVAGVLAVGGIAGGVVLSGQKEPEPSREARPAIEVVSPSPSGERLPFFSFGPTEEPESEPTAAPELSAGPYAALYAGKVEELRDTLGEDGIFYDLVDIDGDEIAELLVNYGGVSGRVDLYTVTPEGELCLAGEGLSSGRMGVPQYAPGRNAVLTQYNGMAGDHQELYDGYYRMGSDGTMALFYESSGSWWGEDDERNTDLTAPEELEGASWESLAGSLTAEEMLSRLGVVIAVPAPEPTPSEEPAPEETPGAEATPEPAEGAYFTEEYREDYDNGDFLEIVLNTDGSMTFHGKLTWEGEFTRYLYAGTEERGAAQEVHSGEEFARVVEVEETAKLVFLVLDNEGELEYGPDGLGQTFQNAEVSLVRFPGLTALEVAPLDFITT